MENNALTQKSHPEVVWRTPAKRHKDVQLHIFGLDRFLMENCLGKIENKGRRIRLKPQSPKQSYSLFDLTGKLRLKPQLHP